MTLSDQVETGAPDALIQLMSPAAAADPYPIYSWLRETAPVCRSRFGAYLVSRYADVQYVLKHAEVFPARTRTRWHRCSRRPSSTRRTTCWSARWWAATRPSTPGCAS
ncbi:hypothetical protein V2I01_42655 [Micromonospora sp. BRA006-A]|nr:hypothetical protein [Micromonospora sp. BRA006-A]